MLMCRQLVAARTPDRRAARARAPSRPKSAIPGSGPVGAATVAVEARRPACGLGACRPAGLGHAPAEPPGTSRLAGQGVFKGPRGGIFQSVTATSKKLPPTEMVKFVDLGVLYFSLVLPGQATWLARGLGLGG